MLDELTVAYLDFAGSNAETIAHLRENGRITLMWCAFQEPPNIVRVHGRGEPVFRDDPRFPELLAHFPDIDTTEHGLRAIIIVHADLVRDTCGYAVPFMAYEEDRDLHGKRFAREDDASLSAYFTKKEHIATSMDGLPGCRCRCLRLPSDPCAPGVVAVLVSASLLVLGAAPAGGLRSPAAAGPDGGHRRRHQLSHRGRPRGPARPRAGSPGGTAGAAAGG